MPSIALKVLRVLLEYGALLWLAYVVVQLGRAMFSSLRTDLRKPVHQPQPSTEAASSGASRGRRRAAPSSPTASARSPWPD